MPTHDSYQPTKEQLQPLDLTTTAPRSINRSHPSANIANSDSKPRAEPNYTVAAMSDQTPSHYGPCQQRRDSGGAPLSPVDKVKEEDLHASDAVTAMWASDLDQSIHQRTFLPLWHEADLIQTGSSCRIERAAVGADSLIDTQPHHRRAHSSPRTRRRGGNVERREANATPST